MLSNVLLTPFDLEMRRRGHRLTRYADDWLLTCRSRGEARAALETAKRILAKLGVTLNAGKTRIVHVRQGFEFLGYKIKQGRRPLRLPSSKITSRVRAGALYAIPRDKSIRNFKDQIRARTRRKAPVTTRELINQINPVIRGWGQYYRKAHVRRLFHQLDGWDRAAHLVASLRALAQQRLDTAARAHAPWRVQACRTDCAGAFLETSLGDADVKAAYGKTVRAV